MQDIRKVFRLGEKSGGRSFFDSIGDSSYTLDTCDQNHRSIGL